ncbi:hypothetical protein [Sphingomonas sp.]|uniref:hypothetical protein n=1 Tax=Sphingomonas sp. TaxID=28214 RepID=UPI003D6C9274
MAMMRLAAMMTAWPVLIGLVLAAPLSARGRAGVAPEFRHIDARTIKSARLILSEIWPVSDLAKGEKGYYAKRSDGVVPVRRAKTCWLTRGQIAVTIAALKRARPRSDDLDVLSADIAIHYRTRAGKEIVAVISDPDPGEPLLIFFDDRLATLKQSDRGRIKRVAAQAGCG